MLRIRPPGRGSFNQAAGKPMMRCSSSLTQPCQLASIGTPSTLFRSLCSCSRSGASAILPSGLRCSVQRAECRLRGRRDLGHTVASREFGGVPESCASAGLLAECG